MPDPVLPETSKICIPGRTLSMFRRAAATSKSAASAKSILVMIATSELLNIVGYFRGLFRGGLPTLGMRKVRHLGMDRAAVVEINLARVLRDTGGTLSERPGAALSFA